MVQMSLFADKNGNEDIENGHMVTGGEATNWESKTDIYTLPCVKYIASGKLLYIITPEAYLSAL